MNNSSNLTYFIFEIVVLIFDMDSVDLIECTLNVILINY
jgi:hypothetical protein